MSEFTELHRYTDYGWEYVYLNVPSLPYNLSRITVSTSLNGHGIDISFPLMRNVHLKVDTNEPSRIVEIVRGLYDKGGLLPSRQPVDFGWECWIEGMSDVELDGDDLSFLFRSFDDVMMAGDFVYILTNREPYMSRYRIEKIEIANNNHVESNWLFQKAYGVFCPLEMLPIKSTDDMVGGELFDGYM